MNTPPCPVCESNHTFVFMAGIFDSETTRVIECRHCGLQFLDPMMSDREEEEYYLNYYENQKTRHYKSLKLENIQEIAFTHYTRYRDIYLDLFKGKKSILEIGSGSGGFIKFIKSNALPVTICSVERSESNLAFLRESYPDVDFVKDASQLDKYRQFDLIVGFGVFEHIKRGRQFLENLLPLFSPEGTLAINIPNKSNPLIDLYHLEEFKKFAYMKQHYYTYTEQSVRMIAGQSGYTVEKFIYIQVYGLDNHISWNINRKPMDFSFYTGFLSPQTIKSYNDDLIRHKMTDLMMVVMKPSR